MAKKPKTGVASQQPPLEIVPSDYVDIVQSNELWSEFTLKDGTVLRLKPSLVEVRKQRNKFSADGNPIYNLNAGLLIGIRAPDSLRQGAKPKRGRKV